MKLWTSSAVVLLIALLGSCQGIFTWGVAYPGGHLLARYRITVQGEELFLTVEVVPQGEGYRVITSFERTVGDAAEVGLSLFSPERMGDSGTADFTPVFALKDKDLRPNARYILEDRSRLITHGRIEIAGVPAMEATFIHPKWPGQRVELAIPDPAYRGLLFLPPLLKVIEGQGSSSKVTFSIELLEFRHDG